MPDYFESGMFVRQAPWHKLGNIIDKAPESIEEARRLAGLEWEPEAVPIYNAKGEPIKGWQGIQRNDTQDLLNIARDSYEIVMNQETFEIVWSVMGQGAYLDTAGSVREGRQVWALAHLDEPMQIAGDPSLVFPYIVMLTSHDGTAACKVLPTTVRVVCWNTFQMAAREGDRTGIQLSFRHTSKVKDRIEQAKRAIEGTRNFAGAWAEQANHLSNLLVGRKQIEFFVNEFIPPPPPHVTMTDRQADNLLMSRQTLRWLINEGPANEGIRHTAYGLYQAAGEYLDHYRSVHTLDSYIGRTLLKAEPAKAKAMKLAKEAASV